jgi:hypothetical protein
MNFNPRSFADFGEARVLAQKTVARMDGVHVGDFRRADDRRICPGSCARSWPARCRWPDRRNARRGCSGPPRSRPLPWECPDPCTRMMMRTAISPRLAMRIFLNGHGWQRGLPVFHRLAVQNQLAFHDARRLASISFMSFMDSMMHSTLPGGRAPRCARKAARPAREIHKRCRRWAI